MLVGPSGAGAAMKLALNAMIAVTNESIGETLAFAERFGIDPAVAYDVLAGGALASPFVLYKRGAFLRPEDEPVAFTTALMLKDVTLALDLAEELGVPMHAASAAQDVLENAVAHGSSEADMASVYRLLRAPGTAPSPATSREES
jgi:3-hydroxyisobutyrate dehydrogenase-like beta-hydroxyacid dehydrogenase